MWTPASIAEPVRAVEAMTRRLAHRGPDDSGIWADQARGIALGFRRLAILDLTPNGAQPMTSADGRYTLVFNGEVYNYRELGQELQRSGASFRGTSDTEVVLAAVSRWGLAAAVKKFIGMFAMAIWDRELTLLHLVRDRLGIKPLYVYRGPEGVAFASELKALVELPGFDRRLDPEALAAFFRYLYVPAPRTIFASVSKLSAGHMLTLAQPGGDIPPSQPYWSIPEIVAAGHLQPFDASDAEVTDAAEALLLDACRLRLRSDVPLGAFLSGGVDSSTVVALMQAASERPVRTFSVGFDSAEHDETRYARAVASALGTDHTELQLSGSDVLNLIPGIPDIFDEPFADASQLPTVLICRAAREAGLVVAVSGDGGDEVFAGYNRYVYGERVIPRALRIPRPVRRAAAAALRSISSGGVERIQGLSSGAGVGAGSRLLGEKISKLSALLSEDDFAGMYRSSLSAWQKPEELVAGHDGEGMLEVALGEGRHLDSLSRMMFTDQMTYLPDDLLAKIDRASMAASLEVRVPLLDHRVVEFGWRLPKRFLIREGRGKWILRSVLRRYLRPELFERPKVGFSVPLEQWLRGPLRQWAEDLLSEDRLRSQDLLRGQEVRFAWSRFNRGGAHNANSIWALLMFQAWHEKWST